MVAARFVETGHPVDYHSVKAVGDGEIIARPERHLAKIGEGEAGDAGDRPRHRDGAALVGEVGGPRRQAVGQGGEGLIEMGRRRGVHRGDVNRHGFQTVEAIIGGAVQMHHLQTRFQ